MAGPPALFQVLGHADQGEECLERARLAGRRLDQLFPQHHEGIGERGKGARHLALNPLVLNQIVDPMEEAPRFLGWQLGQEHVRPLVRGDAQQVLGGFEAGRIPFEHGAIQVDQHVGEVGIRNTRFLADSDLALADEADERFSRSPQRGRWVEAVVRHEPRRERSTQRRAAAAFCGLDPGVEGGAHATARSVARSLQRDSSPAR